VAIAISVENHLTHPDLQVIRDRAPVAGRGGEEPEELLGGRIQQRISLPAEPSALVRMLGQPLQHVSGQRGGGVESTADEEIQHADQLDVWRRLTWHRPVSTPTLICSCVDVVR
jgi:hypothetical protein